MPCHVPPSSHVVGSGSSLQQGDPGRPQHARRLMHLQPLCRTHKAAVKPVGPAKEAAGGWLSLASVPEASSMLGDKAAAPLATGPVLQSERVPVQRMPQPAGQQWRTCYLMQRSTAASSARARSRRLGTPCSPASVAGGLPVRCTPQPAVHPWESITHHRGEQWDCPARQNNGAKMPASHCSQCTGRAPHRSLLPSLGCSSKLMVPSRSTSVPCSWMKR